MLLSLLWTVPSRSVRQGFTSQGCVSQCVVRFVVSLTQCILNARQDFNAQQANDCCETHPCIALNIKYHRFIIILTGVSYIYNGCICLVVSLLRHEGQRFCNFMASLMQSLQNTWPQFVEKMQRFVLRI